MFRVFFTAVIFFLFSIDAAIALDVVYPKQKDKTVNAQSTFFIGNVNKNSTLKINSDNVKIWDEGAFVHLVPLYYGENKIFLEETNNGKKQTQTYIIRRTKPGISRQINIPFIKKQEGVYLYTKTIKDNSTVREKPTTASNRIVELPKNVILYISGKKGDYYKIEEDGNTEFWIHKSNVEKPITVNKRIIAKVSKTENYSDKLYNCTKLTISHPVLYTFEQQDKKIKLTLYGVTSNNQNENQNLEYVFEDDNPVVGYDGKYEDDKFIIRRYKVADKINPHRPLHNVRIFIDAGHGGVEKGSIGPTRVCEKDINLAISKKLIDELTKSEAIVSYSRLDDSQIKLYDRVKMAKDNNAFISLSIHSNALPDGKNPYINHGTETHYYNENSKLLAEIIKNNLVHDLNLKDNGIHKSSFALNRSTNPISVLVEVAYMINPEEYKRLQNDEFQTEVAKSITKSLGQFMILLKK